MRALIRNRWLSFSTTPFLRPHARTFRKAFHVPMENHIIESSNCSRKRNAEKVNIYWSVDPLQRIQQKAFRSVFFEDNPPTFLEKLEGKWNLVDCGNKILQTGGAAVASFQCRCISRGEELQSEKQEMEGYNSNSVRLFLVCDGGEGKGNGSAMAMTITDLLAFSLMSSVSRLKALGPTGGEKEPLCLFSHWPDEWLSAQRWSHPSSVDRCSSWAKVGQSTHGHHSPSSSPPEGWVRADYWSHIRVSFPPLSPHPLL